MNCSVSNCNAKASHMDEHGNLLCDDCYEYLALRLPDPPSIWSRIKARWLSRRSPHAKPDVYQAARMSDAEADALWREILIIDRQRKGEKR